MAHFEKGHTKVGGRQKGTPNKSTAQLKAIISDLLDVQLNKIKEKDKDGFLGTDLPLKERYNILLQLLPYLVPKAKPIELQQEDEDKEDIKIIVK